MSVPWGKIIKIITVIPVLIKGVKSIINEFGEGDDNARNKDKAEKTNAKKAD